MDKIASNVSIHTIVKRLANLAKLNTKFLKFQYWQNTEELCKKDLHNSDNHHGVITYLEPDILECEVKWALEHQYASKFGKLSSGHRTGKGQFLFQSQRKAMPKNAKTTAQLHVSHMLVK